MTAKKCVCPICGAKHERPHVAMSYMRTKLDGRLLVPCPAHTIKGPKP